MSVFVFIIMTSRLRVYLVPQRPLKDQRLDESALKHVKGQPGVKIMLYNLYNKFCPRRLSVVIILLPLSRATW